MTADAIDAALDLVVSRTGVERYRYLVREHPDPKVRASYGAWVLREARGEAHPPAPPLVPVSYGGPPAAPCGACP